MGLLVVAAFTVTIAILWPRQAGLFTEAHPSVKPQARSDEHPPMIVQADPEGHQQQKLAEQKPGPPDPEALRTAAESAERAADTAARLAESNSVPTD